MSDDKSLTGQDRELISLEQDYERRDWAERLGVTEQQLADAVKAVGHSADAVREYLQRR